MALTMLQAEQLVARLTGGWPRSYSLYCGRHAGDLTGFFAEFYAEQRDVDDPTACSECGRRLGTGRDWNQAGHGRTLAEAIEMAYYLIVEPANVRVPPTDWFSPDAVWPAEWLQDCMPAPRPERERQINLS